MRFDKDGNCRCVICTEMRGIRARATEPLPKDPHKAGWFETFLLFATIGIVLLFTVVIASKAYPSDWSSCGIKPPAPISCVHCEAVCQCDAVDRCGWVFVGGGR